MKSNISKQFIALSLASALFTTGCSSSNEDHETSRTGAGASIGAGIGAGVGAIFGGGKGAALGAAAGAVVGGFVGKAWTGSMQDKLQKDIAGTGTQISQMPNGAIKLNIPSEVTFATASATIKPSFQKTLTAIAKTLKESSNIKAEIIGHSDSMGTAEKNIQLSQQRAQSVMNFLAQQGVQSSRLSAKGMGETQPIANNQTDIGRAQNRRVEIILRPIKS